MIEVDKKHTALFNCFKQLSKNAFNSSKEDQGEGGGGGRKSQRRRMPNFYKKKLFMQKLKTNKALKQTFFKIKKAQRLHYQHNIS